MTYLNGRTKRVLSTWSMGLLFGFLNFEIGLGFALLAAAADPGLVRRGPVIAAIGRASLGGILMLTHVFGFVFYAALLAGFKPPFSRIRSMSYAVIALMPSFAPTCE